MRSRNLPFPLTLVLLFQKMADRPDRVTRQGCKNLPVPIAITATRPASPRAQPRVSSGRGLHHPTGSAGHVFRSAVVSTCVRFVPCTAHPGTAAWRCASSVRGEPRLGAAHPLGLHPCRQGADSGPTSEPSARRSQPRVRLTARGQPRPTTHLLLRCHWQWPPRQVPLRRPPPLP